MFNPVEYILPPTPTPGTLGNPGLWEILHYSTKNLHMVDISSQYQKPVFRVQRADFLAFLFKELFLNFYFCVSSFVCVCRCVQMCIGALSGQKKISELLKLK